MSVASWPFERICSLNDLLRARDTLEESKVKLEVARLCTSSSENEARDRISM